MTDKDKDEKPTFFVSRRGRQVGVHQVDLTDMNIDSDESTAAPVEKPVEKMPKNISKKTPRQPLKWSKKKYIIGGVIVLLLLSPLLFAEFVVAQYRQGSSSAKSDLTSIVTGTVLPAQKKDTLTSSQIQAMANQVNDIVADMCRGGLLDNAAGLYPRAKDALADCKSTQTLYTALASDLYDLEKQARYLESMDNLMKPVATPITDDYAVIGAQQTLWQTADEGLKKLSVPTSMKPAHSSLSGHVSAVASTWSALNTANNEQNATAFTEAEQKLATEYEAIRAVSGEFTEILSRTQSEILSSYSKAK